MPSSQPLRLATALATRFAVDRRGLAAFRVALGAVLLVDLGLRARSLAALYSDVGVLPRATLAATHPLYRRLSLHALFGAVWFEGLLFVLAGIAALALMVGYRTRLATLCSFVLLVSLHARNPFALNSGDALLWRLLLWGVFLPLGARWAVDAPAAPDDADSAIAGVATAGLLVQTVVVYATNAVAKLRTDRWTGGVAVRHIFELDHLTVIAGDVLAGHVLLLTVATYAWLALLCCSPLLLLTTGRRRTALTLVFVGAHLTMAVTLAVGVFPLVSVAGLLPFLPSGVWDHVERIVARRRLRSLPRRPHVPLGRRVPALSRVGSALAAVALVVVLATNTAAVGIVAVPAGTPDRAVDHTWSMFAPPPSAARWYEAPATLESGEQVDVLSGGPVGVRPTDAAVRYPSNRWRKVLNGGITQPTVRRSLVSYLCDRWNAAHVDEAVRVELIVVREPTDFDGSERLVRDSLGSYAC